MDNYRWRRQSGNQLQIHEGMITGGGDYLVTYHIIHEWIITVAATISLTITYLFEWISINGWAATTIQSEL